MSSAAVIAENPASGVARPCRIVSMTWPSLRTTVMLRVMPMRTDAGSRLCMPSRYAVAVPARPRPPADARNHAGDEKSRRELVETPAPRERTVDVRRHRRQHEQKDREIH